jgi:hypothetical protein
MEAQAGIRGVLMRSTIIDTGRSSNLAENITPTRYPLEISFFLCLCRLPKPTDPNLVVQEPRTHNITRPSLVSQRNGLRIQTAVGMLEQSSANEAEKN